VAEGVIENNSCLGGELLVSAGPRYGTSSINMDGASQIDIIGNRVRGYNGPGITVSSSTASRAQSSRCSVLSNHVQDCLDAAISIGGGINNTVSNNVCEANGLFATNIASSIIEQVNGSLAPDGNIVLANIPRV
jgi:parallel beta-helix repeat protein